ncbi:WXG100 family type VII secretion target [Nocardia cyriacigeorgica]|uniref:WXG100 family type VII secretion target n=1 Tax=Nocardia cyriacigeorgica TaxID=135487 RepID=A0ABX0CQ96_9NOCA|nr:WXG100 family type VII secretion target [Nocardia cyriacigeorgica]NEW58675.1 WXG100 family type VII secretion target [Nocardia cyriacigeorgica]
MSTEFEVNLTELENLVARLAGLAGFIADHLDDIDDKVAGLQGTGWESIAAQAYADAHRQWSVGARDFVEGVQDMSDAAKAAHGRYRRAIAANARILSSGQP